jgi:hypothetical protein
MDSLSTMDTKGRAMKETKELHLSLLTDLVAKVNAWRRRQDDMPSFSEAIRRLVALGLEAGKGKGGHKAG